MNINPYVEAINQQKLNVEGLVVFQHGKKIGEYRWTPEIPRINYSISKSFTSIAVGMTIDDGKLSLQDRVLDILPGLISNPRERLKKLTLEHLLTMRRGYKEFSSPRTVAEALSQPLDRDPGTFFMYDNACTFLASAMVTKVTGYKVRDLLVKRLFRPLEIPDPVWEESDDGFTIGATGLVISTGDLAKFGQFLLQRGSWQGKQLVSAEWIDTATRRQVGTSESQSNEDWNIGYGYFFWMCRHGVYRGDGMLGQYVLVIKDKDAVIAINSEEENMQPILYTVWDHLLPQL